MPSAFLADVPETQLGANSSFQSQSPVNAAPCASSASSSSPGVSARKPPRTSQANPRAESASTSRFASLRQVAIQQHTEIPRCHIQFQTYVLPEHLFSMVAGNGLGAELVSGCGVLSALSHYPHGCFVRVFTMADIIILGSMGIGRVGTQLSFRDIC